MSIYISVFLGAGLGGVLRYWLSGVVQRYTGPLFPYGTFAVNLLGSFILGIVIFWLAEKELTGREMRFFLTVGFCGGLTTFSTFSFETFNLLRDREFLLAGGNVLLNVAATIAAVYSAYILSK